MTNFPFLSASLPPSLSRTHALSLALRGLSGIRSQLPDYARGLSLDRPKAEVVLGTRERVKECEHAAVFLRAQPSTDRTQRHHARSLVIMSSEPAKLSSRCSCERCIVAYAVSFSITAGKQAGRQAGRQANCSWSCWTDPYFFRFSGFQTLWGMRFVHACASSF
ncbi:hypothetical protein MPTK1_2g24590 [Marchantia polymorpha subsp. ruderalis]|uniref:Uncharacterized protein n=1 Tax=Marchantia polymorpha TaxID=3197 RepID=A0A2R6VZT9_MARPO|nr:hypothetical protein MARPO_0221s0005 [Marchantia polymorpha]BBN03573.1 hypothetical protein Mp_2g24590 [Marchantia polymorpha subsp. ruderalis]|eukprot:PTQ27110.1 hypothetical protein MARPO_0221s0005 [Marchantia polymorpha]